MPVSGSDGYRSGIVTLPNRVRLREMDSRLGMYPTMSRTGDKDRKGNFNVTPFDDRETIVFSNSVQNVMYGSLAVSGSTKSLQPYAGNNDPNGGLTGVGRIISSISDNTRMTDYKELSSRRNDVENLSFFDDSRINLQGTASFYMTGTLQSEYPGFSSRLHDKTQIVIDISSNEQTSIGLINKSSTGTPLQDTSDAKNQLMAYYNFKDKRWEKIARGINGNITSGSFDSVKNMVETAALGFTPIGQLTTGSDFAGTDAQLLPDNYISHYARPTKTFGFPFHPKYFGTGSQVLKMSDYISTPLLVEKIQLSFDEMKFEFSNDTNTGLYAYAGYSRYGTVQSQKFSIANQFGIHSFFLLRQSIKKETTTSTLNVGRRRISTVLTSSTYDSSIPGNAFLSPRTTAGTDTGSTATHVTASRELITYSQLTTFTSASISSQGFPSIPFSSFQNSNLFRDQSQRLSVESPAPTTSAVNLEFTGSITINAPVRVTPKTPLVNALIISSSDPIDQSATAQGLYLEDEFGSRGSGKLDTSSRALFNGQASFKKGEDASIASVDGGSGVETFGLADSDTMDENSPYILFPEDEIIIGYQFPVPRDARQTSIASAGVGSKRTKIVFEGPAKLTLFGSQIKSNKEFHDTLNQPLTSEAVHESLHYDNPVIDQYLISSRQEYSGSYLDKFATGSVGSTVRSLIGTGENVLSSSFQRFLKCTNNKDRYYDTMLPLLTDILIAKNAGTVQYIESHPAYPDGTYVVFLSSGVEDDRNWKSSFVYDTDLPRQKLSSLANITTTETLLSPFARLKSNGTARGSNYFTIFTKESTQFHGRDYVKNVKDLNYVVWGFGSDPNTGAFRQLNQTNFKLELPRGWKYGIWNAFKETTGVIFRPDRFTGQYADIIQQQYDTRFFDEKTNTLSDPPIKIKFVLPDEENEVFLVLDENEVIANTFESSNISIYATSSLPYFDQVTPRNRAYSNLSNRVVEVES